MRTNLNVPYEEKDKARTLGAKWDLARKTWYIEDIRPFMKWIPDYLKKPTKVTTKVTNKNPNRKKY